MTTLLLVGVPLIAVAIVLGLGFQAVGERQVERFEREHGLRTSREARRLLRHYLTTAKRLRVLAFIAVVVVAPLGTIALGGSVHGVDLVSTPVIVALMLATLLAEVTMARPARQDSHRAASLRPREVGAYLSRTLRFGPAVAGVAACATWIATLLVDESALSHVEPRPSPGEVGAGVGLAVVNPVLVTLACRWIVRRPQPLVDPDLVVADDALRTASVRHLSAMGCIVALFNLTGALASYHGTTYGRRDAVVLAIMAIVVGLAWVAWLARAWGPAVPPVRPGTAAATPDGSHAARTASPRLRL